MGSALAFAPDTNLQENVLELLALVSDELRTGVEQARDAALTQNSDNSGNTNNA